MVHGKNADPQRIRVERIYDAPVEELWALWTTKEGLEEWFGPEGAQVEVPTLELRTGGAFEHVKTAVGADQVAYMTKVGRPLITRVRGHFVEVVHHERLHMRMTIDFLPGVAPYPYDIRVEFHSELERVRMVVTADVHPDAEMTRLAALGLSGQLRRLDAVLAARSASVQRLPSSNPNAIGGA